MNKKLLILSLALPLSAFAINKTELKGSKDSHNINFELNMSNLDQYEFVQVEPDVFVYKDRERKIEIVKGAKGIERHLENLENQLSNFEDGDNLVESYYKYDKLISDISFYSSKYEDISTLNTGNANLENGGTHIGSCIPFFTQNYNFYAHIFGWGFSVTSSYPSPPGPFPPGAGITMTASSEMKTITTQAIYNSYNQNTYNGNNHVGGSVAAGSGYYNGVSIVNKVTWEGISTLLTSNNCFEYIIYSDGMKLGKVSTLNN